jgi:hypothetical protein
MTVTAPTQGSGVAPIGFPLTAPLRQLRLSSDAGASHWRSGHGSERRHSANCANCAKGKAGAVEDWWTQDMLTLTKRPLLFSKQAIGLCTHPRNLAEPRRVANSWCAAIARGVVNVSASPMRRRGRGAIGPTGTPARRRNAGTVWRGAGFAMRCCAMNLSVGRAGCRGARPSRAKCITSLPVHAVGQTRVRTSNRVAPPAIVARRLRSRVGRVGKSLSFKDLQTAEVVRTLCGAFSAFRKG